MEVHCIAEAGSRTIWLLFLSKRANAHKSFSEIKLKIFSTIRNCLTWTDYEQTGSSALSAMSQMLLNLLLLIQIPLDLFQNKVWIGLDHAFDTALMAPAMSTHESRVKLCSHKPNYSQILIHVQFGSVVRHTFPQNR